MRLLRAFAALALAVPFASALPKISRHGKYLYDEGGNRFFIKGVAYQPAGQLAESTEANEANGGFPEPSSYVDPLSSAANCTRDIPYLTQLGVNAVRVYSVNPNVNHDSCMAQLNQAGIYVILDVSLPLNGSIDRSSPAWTTNLMNEYLTTINVFSAYENVLAYNIGNEVVNLPANTDSLPFVKAAARDVKSYLKSINSNVLVGYSATDGPDDFRTSVAEYLTCGNETETVDIIGLNNYAWCGNSSYQSSTWANVVRNFTPLNVPAYMSEFGCVEGGTRLWTEVPVLLSEPMSDVFSGGVAFSYFAANNGPYALVEISGDGKTITPNADFERLEAQFKASSGPNSPAASAAAAPAPACPPVSANFRASTQLPPTPNLETCNCVNDNSLGCHIVPQTASEPLKIGELIDYTCSQLGSQNSSVTCQGSIGGNGTTGDYAPLSMCSPEIKLNWAMSAYWLATGLKAESCDFGGNATVQAKAPADAAAANSASEQCLSGKPPVITPTATDAPASKAPTDPAQITDTPSPSGATGRGGAVSLVASPASVAVAVVGVVLGAVAAL